MCYLNEIGVFLLKLYGTATSKKICVYEPKCITAEKELIKKLLMK